MEKIQSVPSTKVVIKEGFWHQRQRINAEATVYAIYDRFAEAGKFESIQFAWKPGDTNKPHIFWDSDVAKWVEAASVAYRSSHDERLIGIIEGIIDRIEAHQDPSGYFNTWFTVVEPDKRWQIRTAHELYCAGHLIEAAVAYYETTGRDRFLKLMCRFADHIERAFVKDGTAGYVTPGHEEIELALVRLYRATGERRYLELARFFIDNRGADDPASFYSYANAKYTQDHLPVRQQLTAEGHAVRATYLYSAMADIAWECGDDALLTACRRLFEDIARRKMYITGGIGSSCNGEAFTIPYDLPNLTAYTESCAAIGLAFFARRMLCLENDSLYADVIERILYNGFLSTISLDGRSFFYENPLEIDPKLRERDTSIVEGKSRFPSARRLSMFNCSCCPPNISRLIGCVGDYLYTQDGSTVYVHQYVASDAEFAAGGRAVRVVQETDYPRSGGVALTVAGLKGGRLAVRIPGWCQGYSIGGAPDGSVVVLNGYAHIPCTEDRMALRLDFAMEPQLIEASPHVQDDSGRVALQCGPVVYCLEEADNGRDLRDVSIDPDTDYAVSGDAFFGACTIEADGSRRDPESFKTLYQPAESRRIKQRLKFIPYFGFANRDLGEMIVWITALKDTEQTATTLLQ